MNPRIKELMKQSMVEYQFDLRFSPEKFAELIVKECLGDLKERIALRYQGSEKDRDIGYGMEIVYMDIVDKFGVE